MIYLYITPFFPSTDSWRGAYCLDFVKALRVARPNMRVEVFVPGEGENYEVGGVRVHRFKVRYLPSNILPFLFRRNNEMSFLRAVENAGLCVKDVVVCHGNTANFAIYPLALKRLNRQTKTLLHHHDLASFGVNNGMLHRCSLYNVFLFRRLRELHEQIDCHVFISEVSRRSFLTAPDASWTVYDDYKAQMRGPKLFRCRPVRIKESVVLHNGVCAELFNHVEHVERVVWGRKEFVIGCVGNFVKLKDQMTLLKAVDILNYVEHVESRIKVIFIGSGEKMAECKRFAVEKGIPSEFRQEVRHEDLPAFYRELDLFVLPSYFEGFGCVYAEAWACGVPFIACEGQGIEDLIASEDRDKWLCKSHNPKDLAEKIAAYMKNRRQQRLTGPVDLQTLVSAFCKNIGI